MNWQNDIDVLTEFDKEDFEQLEEIKVVGITEKALKIENIVNGKTNWLPISQLRIDFDGNIWVKNWLRLRI
jgi:hypothetical protein